MSGLLLGWAAPERPELEGLLRQAAQHPMTSQERREQAVSWVYGQLGSKSTRTKDEVRQTLLDQGLI